MFRINDKVSIVNEFNKTKTKINIRLNIVNFSIISTIITRIS